MKLIEFEITTTKLIPRKRKLLTGWKTWYCLKCGDGFIYKGKRPKHKNCKGYFVFEHMWGVEAEQELIDYMAEEIKKEVGKAKENK